MLLAGDVLVKLAFLFSCLVTFNSWQGEEVDCSEIFTPVISDSGVCCAFNLHRDLKRTNYSKLVEEMQVTELERINRKQGGRSW